MLRRLPRPRPRIALGDQFGVHTFGQVARTAAKVLGTPGRYTFTPSTAGLLRPDLSLAAYAGLLPADGVAPIFNFFDRTAGGTRFDVTTSRDSCRDYRGGRLTYDQHDGTDFVCPPGTPLVSAAPGVVVATRENFLRGGLTLCVDHGHGVVTQYTHLSRTVASLGQPVRRGDTVALSGSAGFDMLSGFPWVPPHVHFMTWVRGRPVDPYRAVGEPLRPGLWLHGNEPRTSGPLADDDAPPKLDALPVDSRALDALVARCRDADIRAEIARAPSLAARAAIVEDSLHHDRLAWDEQDPDVLRPATNPARVRLTLPLPLALYRAARPVDSRWTRP